MIPHRKMFQEHLPEIKKGGDKIDFSNEAYFDRIRKIINSKPVKKKHATNYTPPKKRK